jgi:8-oxo-dGTP diphosphatase
MKTPVRFVVGFLIDDYHDEVLLIFKRHGPPCVVGKWNGVGGHIEPGEGIYKAMAREFKEETGLVTKPLNWTLFCELTSKTAIVYFFYKLAPKSFIKKARTTTDEGVFAWPVYQLPERVVENLRWMIPFLCDPTTVHSLGKISYIEDPIV